MRVNALALVAVVAAGLAGCGGYKKLGTVYGDAFARLLPTAPPPAAPAAADASAQYLQAATLVAQADAMDRDTREPRAEAPVEPAYQRPRDEQPAPRRDPPAREPDVTVTQTVVRAPTYPSSPFVALFPERKGSSTTMCRAFTDSTDNQGACMSACRAQMM